MSAQIPILKRENIQQFVDANPNASSVVYTDRRSWNIQDLRDENSRRNVDMVFDSVVSYFSNSSTSNFQFEAIVLDAQENAIGYGIWNIIISSPGAS